MLRKMCRNNLNNVWDGLFEVILDNGQVIAGSFKVYYGMNGINIPKGHLIKFLIIKNVPNGFVPMVIFGENHGMSIRLITSIDDILKTDGHNDLRYEVVNPQKVPDIFSFTVCSNQLIADGSWRSTKGLFWTKHDISIWQNKS